MASWCNPSRSFDAVAGSILKVEPEPCFDVASDDEEDHTQFESETEPDRDHDLYHNGVEIKSEPDDDEPPVKQCRAASTTFGIDERIRNRVPNIIRGANNHRWQAAPPGGPRTTPMGSFPAGPLKKARYVRSPVEAWQLLINEDMLNKIVLHTNQEMERSCPNPDVDESPLVHAEMDLIELKAFIGLLYFSGLYKGGHTNRAELWDPSFGSNMFRGTMSFERFAFISKCIRFDDKQTRSSRRQMDAFAPIRDIWQAFLTNCNEFYSPGTRCTIDEQFLYFAGRCGFKVNRGNDPDKFGIKIAMINDSRTFYMLNAEPYMVRAKEHNEKLAFFKRLTVPICGTGRNVTCSASFTNATLFDNILKDYSLTLVGNLRTNQPEIPPSFKLAGGVSTSKFAFDATKAIVAYTAKPNKVIIALSTLHKTPEINVSGKPEIISFFDATRRATVIFDQMCNEYSTARKTARWPLRVFFGMLDQSAVNALVLYNFNIRNEMAMRRNFLKRLSMDLVKPHLERRMKMITLGRGIRMAIYAVIGVDEVFRELRGPGRPGKLGRCVFCPRAMDRKSRIACGTCKVSVCEVHRSIQCDRCLLHC